MDIVALEKNLANFYAPVAQVMVEGKELLSMGIEIISASVDNTLEGADQFTFIVNNGFDIEKREFRWLGDVFDFGKKVKINMGYLDKVYLMIVGTITSIKTSFPAGSLPQITISGFDLSYCMTRGKYSKSWDDKKDSDVVREITAKYGLTASVQDTKVVHPRIEQSQESDMQFIKKLAERNGFEFYVYDDTLYFSEPANNESAGFTLEWGKGLVSFTPEINLSEQIDKVEVVGWDVKNKKEIIGKAATGDEPGRDSGRKSGGEVVKKICQEPKSLRIRQPVYSQQQADRRAKAILKKRSEGFVKGSGECIGIPQMYIDQNIQLGGLGKMFSKTYYIEKSTHSVSSSGYKTTFNVKDTTI